MFIQMGLASNDGIKAKCDYYSVLGWFLDCWTVLLKNVITYIELVFLFPFSPKKREENRKFPWPSTP